jgi:hypothetical protein
VYKYVSDGEAAVSAGYKTNTSQWRITRVHQKKVYWRDERARVHLIFLRHTGTIFLLLKTLPTISETSYGTFN